MIKWVAHITTPGYGIKPPAASIKGKKHCEKNTISGPGGYDVSAIRSSERPNVIKSSQSGSKHQIPYLRNLYTKIAQIIEAP